MKSKRDKNSALPREDRAGQNLLAPVQYLEVCRMAGNFAARQGKFPQESLAASKKISRSMAAKGPPAGVLRDVKQAAGLSGRDGPVCSGERRRPGGRVM